MNIANKKHRAGLYARVSSQEQVNEGVSIDAQMAALRAYSKSQEWEVVDEYIDGGFSGGTDDRPALKRLIIDANRGRFDIIAVCKLDRFFRNLRLLLNYLHNFEQLDIKFISAQEGLDTSTPYGRFAVQIMGVIAEFERGRIGERVKDSRKYLVDQGKWPGGRTLYGYRWLSDKKQWEIVPEEAKVVRLIYDLYVHRKMGIESIVATLNRNGVSTHQGTSWRFSTVRSILSHPGYQGQHKTAKAMPVIIDENIWQKAQQRKEESRRILAKPKNWFLQGMCFCGRCGHVLRCTQKKPGATRYYACHGRIHADPSQESSQRCKLPFIRADWLEQAVWEKVKDVLNNSDKMTECVNKALIDLEARRDEIDEENSDIESKLEIIRAKQERLGMAFTDGAVHEPAYKSKLKRLKNEEQFLLRSQQDINPEQLGKIAYLSFCIETVKEILDHGSIHITDFGLMGNMGEDNSHISGITDFITGNQYLPDNSLEDHLSSEKQESLIRNRRALLQMFNIKVVAYPERVEIQGTIPTEVLENRNMRRKPDIAPIISSPFQTQVMARAICQLFARGRVFERGQSPLSFLLPFPAKKDIIIFNVRGWKGDQGDRYIENPILNITPSLSPLP